MPVNAYGLQFEDLFQGRNKVNDVRLRIALDERKRQQYLADAAALFDRQLTKQEAWADRQLNKQTTFEKARLAAQSESQADALRVTRAYDMERRSADQVSDLEKLRQSNDINIEYFRKQKKVLEDDRIELEERIDKVKDEKERKKLLRLTKNYRVTEAQIDEDLKKATELQSLPVGEKNKIVADVVNGLSNDEKLKKAYFLASSDKDISQNIGKLPEKIKEEAELRIQARIDQAMRPRIFETQYLSARIGERRNHLLSFIKDVDLSLNGELPSSEINNPLDTERNLGIESQPANPANQIQQFKARKLGAAGQQMFDGSTTAAPIPATASVPPEFLTVPGERGKVMPAIEAAGDWMGTTGRRMLLGPTPPPLDLSGVSGAYNKAKSFVAGTPATQTGIKMDDFVGWLANNEPTLTGKNPMVIKAIIANPVNKGRLTNWIQQFQQNQDVAQQGQQMFSPSYAPSASEVDNPEFNPF